MANRRFSELEHHWARESIPIHFHITKLHLFWPFTLGRARIQRCLLHKVKFRFPQLHELWYGFCRSLNVDHHDTCGFWFGWELWEKSWFEYLDMNLLSLDPVATLRVRLNAFHIRDVRDSPVILMYGTMNLVEIFACPISGNLCWKKMMNCAFDL